MNPRSTDYEADALTTTSSRRSTVFFGTGHCLSTNTCHYSHTLLFALFHNVCTQYSYFPSFCKVRNHLLFFIFLLYSVLLLYLFVVSVSYSDLHQSLHFIMQIYLHYLIYSSSPKIFRFVSSCIPHVKHMHLFIFIIFFQLLSLL